MARSQEERLFRWMIPIGLFLVAMATMDMINQLRTLYYLEKPLQTHRQVIFTVREKTIFDVVKAYLTEDEIKVAKPYLTKEERTEEQQKVVAKPYWTDEEMTEERQRVLDDLTIDEDNRPSEMQTSTFCDQVQPVVEPCMKERHYNAQAMCNLFEGKDLTISPQENLYKHLIVNENEEMIFCNISFLGKTSMREFYYAIDKGRDLEFTDDRAIEKLGLKTLDMYSKEQQDMFLGYFDKIIITQHPVDKLWNLFLQKYPLNAVRELKSFGKDLFGEFISFQLESSNVEPVLRSIQSQCAPCFIDYTVWIKLETLSTDSMYLSACHSSAPDSEFDPEVYMVPSAQDENAGPRTLEGFAEIGLTHVEQIYDYYGEDMKMMNYGLDRKEDGSVQATTDELLSKCLWFRPQKLQASYP